VTELPPERLSLRRFRLQRDVRSVGAARGLHAVASSDRVGHLALRAEPPRPADSGTRLETAASHVRSSTSVRTTTWIGDARGDDRGGQEALATYGTGACGSPVLSG